MKGELKKEMAAKKMSIRTTQSQVVGKQQDQKKKKKKN